MVVTYLKCNRPNQYRMLHYRDDHICGMHHNREKNETPDMEVSNWVDLINGRYRSGSFNKSAITWVKNK